MRFLGIGDSCDLGALYLRLQADGHEVRVAIADPQCQGTLAGLVARTDDWQDELGWVQAAGADGIILFENVADRRGALQDQLRRDGLNVIGGSAFGDRLENDRAYAQELLASIGLSICPTHEFDQIEAALSFIESHPARYVLKFNGPGFASADNYVGMRPDGSDVKAMLAARDRDRPVSFILMEHVAGIEMGTGAYFDGERFIEPACLDWEHKRFFTGDLGELTGEMGTVVTFDRSRRFFARTLKPLTEILRQHGHCGYVNLNTIVNDRGIWPLEFTCRFGYPGFALLGALQRTDWGDLFRGMATRSLGRLSTAPGFATGLVLTVPPFPYTRRQVSEKIGLPVMLDPTLTEADRRHLHYGEVGLKDGALVTSGVYGWTMVVTGTAGSIAASRLQALARAEKVFTPNLRYRRDIGERLIAGDFAALDRLGLLDPTPASGP